MTALADAYRQAGFGVQVLGSDARKGHLLVTFPSGADCRVEALRDQLDYAAMYPDEAFARYRCGLDLIVDIKAWAQAWANRLGLELAQDEPWTDEDRQD
jgi:hypothetical protein